MKEAHRGGERPALAAVVAMASNRVIGKDGGLPWRLPEDLKWFKKLTVGHSIVMGRRTMESLGRPLPKRRNVVVSRSLEEAPEGFELAGGGDEAIERCAGEPRAFVIGGAGLFADLLPRCEECYLSYVFHPYEGDVRLPDFEGDFRLQEVLHRDADFELRRYVRRGRAVLDARE